MVTICRIQEDTNYTLSNYLTKLKELTTNLITDAQE